jgi:DNA-binding LytR/AlgR family response regulator
MTAFSPPTLLIAEDEPVLAEELREAVAELWPELRVVATVHDGDAALRALAMHRPDVLLLDVRMPGLDGLEVARLAGGKAHVVFITAYSDYAVQAFEEGAVDYVLKPLERERLQRALDRIRQRLHEPAPDLRPLMHRVQSTAAPETQRLRWLTVQHGRELRMVLVDEVCYFQADSKYVGVTTAETTGLITLTIKDLCARLDPDRFWQVHRSTIVNVESIASVSRSSVGGGLLIKLKQRPEQLQVSASYAHRFKLS